MEIKRLDWDSEFFDKNIGRINLTPNDTELDLLNTIQTSRDFHLLYLFSDRKLELPKVDNRCNLVDQKVTYLCNLTQESIHKSENKSVIISEFSGNTTPYEIEMLTYQSGEYSRFKTDKGFKPSDFYKLYKTWIDKSILKEIADAVYIAKVDNKISGFVSVKLEPHIAKIGLIAVDKDSRGKRIGTSLIEYLKIISLQKGITKLFVDTQYENSSACRFYEKNGFSQHNLVNIYHYWT